MHSFLPCVTSLGMTHDSHTSRNGIQSFRSKITSSRLWVQRSSGLKRPETSSASFTPIAALNWTGIRRKRNSSPRDGAECGGKWRHGELSRCPITSNVLIVQSVRWILMAFRQADLETLGSVLQQYREGHDSLIRWIEETTEKQENTKPEQTDSRALSEQLAQQTVRTHWDDTHKQTNYKSTNILQSCSCAVERRSKWKRTELRFQYFKLKWLICYSTGLGGWDRTEPDQTGWVSDTL